MSDTDPIPQAFSVPYVIEKTGRGERVYDLYSRLLEDRIVFLGTGIDDMVANVIVAQLLFLAKQNKAQDIQMYINSPGGSVTAGLAIYDTMQYIECDVATYCIGQCASMGAILLAGGTRGKRYILPHSRVMIHQPWAPPQGWWIITREWGRAKRRPGSPAARITAAILAASPTTMVETGAFTYCMVS